MLTVDIALRQIEGVPNLLKDHYELFRSQYNDLSRLKKNYINASRAVAKLPAELLALIFEFACSPTPYHLSRTDRPFESPVMALFQTMQLFRNAGTVRRIGTSKDIVKGIENCQGGRKTRLAIISTCQTWRNIALSTGALWTRTGVDTAGGSLRRDLRYAERELAKSRGRPLELFIKIQTSEELGSLSRYFFVSQVLRRYRTLYLDCEKGVPERNHALFKPSTPVDFPLLERLYYHWMAPNPSPAGSFSLDLSLAPNLRRVVIAQVNPRLDGFIFPATGSLLTHLCLDGAVHLTGVIHTISSCPNLECLALDFPENLEGENDNHDPTWTPPIPPTFSLPRLRQLALTGYPSIWVRNFDAPAVDDLALENGVTPIDFLPRADQFPSLRRAEIVTFERGRFPFDEVPGRAATAGGAVYQL